MIKTLPTMFSISFFERNEIKRILVNFFEIKKNYYISQVHFFRIKKNLNKFFITPLILMLLVSFQNYAQGSFENSLSGNFKNNFHDKENTPNAYGKDQFLSNSLTMCVNPKAIQDLKYTIVGCNSKSELVYTKHVEILSPASAVTSSVNTNLEMITALSINGTATSDEPNVAWVITKLFSINFGNDFRWC